MTLNGEYIEYITQQNDTWDYIAWIMYGNETLMGVLIEANPQIPIAPLIGMGLTMAIPIIGDLRPTLNNEQRPPWRQK